MFKAIILLCASTVQLSRCDIQALDLTQLIPLEISSAGRVAKLGELYDARSDQFLHMSIAKSNFATTQIQSTPNKESKLQSTLLNTFEEKFRVLDFTPEVKLSVLGGLVEPQGSARFVKDTKKSGKSAKATLIQSLSTTYDTIGITDTAVRPLINDDVVAGIDATHVVVGIEWGANVVVSVEDFNQDDRDVQQAQDNLDKKIKYLGSLLGTAPVNVSDADKNELNKLGFTIYGDLVPDNVPQTLIEALQFMKTSPSLLPKTNQGKGMAMKYTLLPLPALRKIWKMNTVVNTVVNRVDQTNVMKCVKLFDDMTKVGQKLNDVVDEVTRIQDYVESSKVKKINDLKYNYDVHLAQVQTHLSDHLVKVRAGSEGIETLQNVIDEASKSKYLLDNMNNNDFSMIIGEISLIKQLVKLQITMLDKNRKLEDLLWNNYEKDIYILFYSYNPSTISDPTLNLFRKMIENKNQFGTKAMFVAANLELFQHDKMKRTNKISVYKNATLVIDYYKDGDKNKQVDPKNPEMWSLCQLQQHILSIENHLATVDKNDQAQTVELNTVKQNPVPIGFVYVQLPGQSEPGQLWPSTHWSHISPNYAGNFFRAEGGGSASFGQVQPQSYNRITAFKADVSMHHRYVRSAAKQYDLVEGQWSGVTKDRRGVNGNSMDWLQFYSTKVDNYPRNQAVRIWQRIK